MACKVAATWNVERAWAHHLSKTTGSLLTATETIQSQDTGQVFGFEVMLSIYKQDQKILALENFYKEIKI